MYKFCDIKLYILSTEERYTCMYEKRKQSCFFFFFSLKQVEEKEKRKKEKVMWYKVGK